ncbi:hypothetical protein [Kerstersia gyiorum]|uniref:hypothetical protein n=1 Tax=Kerstersia gyiorum TaxID=206506 RepID=UPI00102ABC9A|nr:hypothetical protein [Kerstersia gyiorum]MCO7636490.1 hypothetical protein [Pseudomonas sp. S 311-6]KAB0543741.1 hypothetical protein F7P85_07715 [Kerstersia gyiorum]MCP1636934.1 hypothetical protein [Kerstersia gyiorum]MCP1678936.1 hypothetical protein [Kerstersia gyiorum]MCP1708319.1 hypothetical protein [Kerstersia gyiorum]
MLFIYGDAVIFPEWRGRETENGGRCPACYLLHYCGGLAAVLPGAVAEGLEGVIWRARGRVLARCGMAAFCVIFRCFFRYFAAVHKTGNG